MKKEFVAFLVVAMLASSMAGPAPLTSFPGPFVKGQDTFTCFIGIVQRMSELTTNPGGLLMDLFACYGDRTWDYIAPFLGGYIRPLSYQTWNGLTPDNNGNRPITELELYNFIMTMIKQAIGEVLNFSPLDPNFRYKNSTQA